MTTPTNPHIQYNASAKYPKTVVESILERTRYGLRTVYTMEASYKLTWSNAQANWLVYWGLGKYKAHQYLSLDANEILVAGSQAEIRHLVDGNYLPTLPLFGNSFEADKQGKVDTRDIKPLM